MTTPVRIPPIAAELSREQLTPEIVRHLRALEEASGILLRVCEEARVSAVTLQRSSSALRSEKLMSLERKKNLQELGLYRTSVTDAGLLHLRALSALRVLNLGKTHVTDTGVAELQRALPHLDFLHL